MTSYLREAHYSGGGGPSSNMYFTPINNRERESYQSFGSIGSSRRRLREVRYDETPGRIRKGGPPHFAEGISVNVNSYNPHYDDSKYSVASAVTSRASYQLESSLPNVRPQKPCKITFKMEQNQGSVNVPLTYDHVIDTQKEYETFSEKTYGDSYTEGIVIHHSMGGNRGGLSAVQQGGETYSTSQKVFYSPKAVIKVPQSAKVQSMGNYSGSGSGSFSAAGMLDTETVTEITKSPEWRIMRQSRADDNGEKIYYELKQIKNERGEWTNVDVLPGDTANMATSSSQWAKWSTKSVDPITGSMKTDPMPNISGEYWIQRKKDNTWKRVRYHWEHDPNGQWKKVNSDNGKIITTQGNWKTGTAWELDKRAVPRKVNYEWIMDSDGQWRMEKKGRKNRPVDTSWQEGSEWVTKGSESNLVNYRWVQEKNGKWLKLNQDSGDIMESVPKGKGLNITKADVQYYYDSDKSKLIKNVTTMKYNDGKLRSKKVHQEDIPKEESDFLSKQAALRSPPELVTTSKVKGLKKEFHKWETDASGKTIKTTTTNYTTAQSKNITDDPLFQQTNELLM